MSPSFYYISLCPSPLAFARLDKRPQGRHAAEWKNKNKKGGVTKLRNYEANGRDVLAVATSIKVFSNIPINGTIIINQEK
jgi:hypothetical protein